MRIDMCTDMHHDIGLDRAALRSLNTELLLQMITHRSAYVYSQRVDMEKDLRVDMH